MTPELFLKDLARRGVRLAARGDRLIVDSPLGALRSEEIDRLKRHKRELLPLVVLEQTDSERTLPIDLGRIADAIARQPRSPFLNDLAIATIVKVALAAQAVLAELCPSARAAALAHCRELENAIARAILSRDYQSAYEIAARLDRLPREITELLPQ